MLSVARGCWCFSLAVVDLSLHPAGESVTELLSHSCVFMLSFFPYPFCVFLSFYCGCEWRAYVLPFGHLFCLSSCHALCWRESDVA